MSADGDPFWICRTCAVEHAEKVPVCAICADERQYVPAEGQQWTSLSALVGEGCRAELFELETDLWGVTTSPEVGIGQQSKVIRTPEGMLLWDPIGFVDGEIVRRVQELGEVVAIVASHPHMFGAQVEWSRWLGDVPVLVAQADLEWVARPDPIISSWTGPLEILPGVTLSQPGGHFPGSAVAHWAAGCNGRGVLLTGDTIMPNPDRRSFSFMRSYPNRIPLSAAVARRVAQHVESFEFDRVYGNFDDAVLSDARALVRWSADRHADWVSGVHDDLT